MKFLFLISLSVLVSSHCDTYCKENCELYTTDIDCTYYCGCSSLLSVDPPQSFPYTASLSSPESRTTLWECTWVYQPALQDVDDLQACLKGLDCPDTSSTESIVANVAAYDWQVIKPSLLVASPQMQGKAQVLRSSARERLSLANTSTPRKVVLENRSQLADCPCIMVCYPDPENPDGCLDICSDDCEEVNSRSFTAIKQLMNSGGEMMESGAIGGNLVNLGKSGDTCKRMCVQLECSYASVECFDLCYEKCGGPGSVSTDGLVDQETDGETVTALKAFMIVAVLFVIFFIYKARFDAPKKYRFSNPDETAIAYAIIP